MPTVKTTVNGLTVIADQDMDPLPKRSVAVALSTITSTEVA